MFFVPRTKKNSYLAFTQRYPECTFGARTIMTICWIFFWLFIAFKELCKIMKDFHYTLIKISTFIQFNIILKMRLFNDVFWTTVGFLDIFHLSINGQNWDLLLLNVLYISYKMKVWSSCLSKDVLKIMKMRRNIKPYNYLFHSNIFIYFFITFYINICIVVLYNHSLSLHKVALSRQNGLV